MHDMKTCLNCKREFFPVFLLQKYCSPLCGMLHKDSPYKHNAKARRDMERLVQCPTATCTVNFTNRGNIRFAYCSSCLGRRKELQKAGVPLVIPKFCIACKKAFTPSGPRAVLCLSCAPDLHWRNLYYKSGMTKPEFETRAAELGGLCEACHKDSPVGVLTYYKGPRKLLCAQCHKQLSKERARKARLIWVGNIQARRQQARTDKFLSGETPWPGMSIDSSRHKDS